MALVIDGELEEVPGLDTHSWHDDARLRLRIGQDGRVRPKTWIRAVVLHTTNGIPGGKDTRAQTLRNGFGHPQGLPGAIGWWSTSPASAGAHLVVDSDGATYCLADLELEESYHATSVNPVSIGVEVVQQPDGALYAGQLEAVAVLVDFLTLRFGIQRQIHWPYKGKIARLAAGGLDAVGVYGHRDQTDARGFGDPGDFVMEALLRGGYEPFDFGRGEDLTTWKARQETLTAKNVYTGAIDGVAGPATVAAIRAIGLSHTGLWAHLDEGEITSPETPMSKRPPPPS